MPNWAFGTVAITGSKEGILNFTRRFIYEGTDRDKIEPNFFARSFAQATRSETVDEIENLYANVPAEAVDTFCMNVYFAWSANNCLIDGYPQQFPECISLADACVTDRVSVEILTEEPGISFEENIHCDKDGRVTSVSRDMPIYTCPLCGNGFPFPSYLDIGEYICPVCEESVLRLKAAD